MKEVTLEPSEIGRALKIAHDTFGTFEFTHVPERIKEGEDVTDGPDANFWEDSVYCACFFPKLAHGYASDPANATGEAELQNRIRGFEQVCFIFGCNAEDEVVAIRPRL